MASKKKNTLLSTIAMVMFVALIVWMKFREVREEQERDGERRDEQVAITVPGSAGQSAPQPNLRVASLTSGRFQIWRNCRLIERRGNDGDSFHVQTPQGKEEIRLYYVDAPESAARTYRDGNNNHKRIADQGKAMGGLDQHQTTQVGVAAKAFVKKLLADKTFTVATTGESVYRSHRKYAFVIVDWQGQSRYLHELLVAYGLGRIHTKPMTLPDNTSASRQKKHLYELRKFAQNNRFGAWGVR